MIAANSVRLIRTITLVALISTAAVAKQSGSLTIAIPSGISPESVRIFFEVFGERTFVSALKTIANVRQYKLFPLDKSSRQANIGKIKAIILLVYVPGHRIVTERFGQTQLDSVQTFTPTLIPLSSVSLSGQLLNSQGSRVPNADISVEYSLKEAAEFFGVPDANLQVPITMIHTDPNGVFSGMIALLPEDPFITKYPNGRFRLAGRLESGTAASLQPDALGIQRTYEPVTIRATAFGKVTGKLSDEYIRSLKIPNYLKGLRNREEPAPSTIRLDLIPAELDKQTPGEFSIVPIFGYDTKLMTNGKFSVDVPPGHYNLNLRYQPHYKLFYVKVPVELEIAVKESGQHRIEK